MWITRLQAGVRQYAWRYSAFIPALKQSNIVLNRKVLAELAANEPFALKAVVDVVEMQTGQYRLQAARELEQKQAEEELQLMNG